MVVSQLRVFIPFLLNKLRSEDGCFFSRQSISVQILELTAGDPKRIPLSVKSPNLFLIFLWNERYGNYELISSSWKLLDFSTIAGYWPINHPCQPPEAHLTPGTNHSGGRWPLAWPKQPSSYLPLIFCCCCCCAAVWQGKINSLHFVWFKPVLAVSKC